MKKRSIALLFIVSALALILASNSAFARGAHHERWKGIAIGIGVAILANAIINHNNYYTDRESERCSASAYIPERNESYYQGHWEVRDEWTPPIYRKVWNPAHYNARGEWVEGAWIQIVDKPGCWIEKRVWVRQ